MILPLNRHWYVNGPLPPTPTLKVTLVPGLITLLPNGVVIDGGGRNDNVAGELLTEPALLLTSTV
jgi:hypothetical protein